LKPTGSHNHFTTTNTWLQHIWSYVGHHAVGLA